MGKFGKTCYLVSPYGISEIAQAFSRLCAVFGGTTMLNTNILNLQLNRNESAPDSFPIESKLKLPDGSCETYIYKRTIGKDKSWL